MDIQDRESVKFGEHLIIDAYGCNPEKLGDMELCYDVLVRMADMAKMKRMMPPMLIKSTGNEVLGGKDPGGFSGFVIIKESHISIHTFVRRGFVTFDLYSCKEFSSEDLVKYLKETFETKDIDVLKIDRGLKYPKDNIYQ